MTEKRRALPVWQETILLGVLALVMALVVKTFFVQAFYIPSESMEPGLVPNDKLLVQKVSYWGGNDPDRGDIVVFEDPGNWLGGVPVGATNPVQKALEAIGLFPTGGHLIKRVIAVGGDSVRCCDSEGRTVVNGEPLDEPYLMSAEANQHQTYDQVVPDGYVWVLGDNRGNSQDSRAHLGQPGGGFISVDAIVGKAWLRVWPLDRFGFISSD